MSKFKYIAVNNHNGWGKGATSSDARLRSMVDGPKATRVRIWRIGKGLGDWAHVDEKGSVNGIVPASAQDYARKHSKAIWKRVKQDPNIQVWKEEQA